MTPTPETEKCIFSKNDNNSQLEIQVKSFSSSSVLINHGSHLKQSSRGSRINMAPEEEKPKVCRLCGQLESIYIDVFSEEGTKRFLNFKIQSKMNILIEPNGRLPQVICMRCVGTVEFLCDFHNMCHETQAILESADEEEANAEEKSNEKPESDVEHDKENILPSKSGPGKLTPSDKETVLPSKSGKQKGKLSQSNSSKYWNTEEHPEEADTSNDQSVKITDDFSGSDAVNINGKHCEYIEEELTANHINDQNNENETSNTSLQFINSQKNAVLKRNRSISITSLEYRFSEGKLAKISELMTEEQKQDIESQYSIDMRLVDESEVQDNIIYVEKKFQCKICNVTYPRLDKCQVHIWRHLDMKPYLCKLCDFSTLTVSNIRCHIRKSHLKLKPFECNLCRKRYTSATLLEEHMNIHTGSRPYQCKFCEFASATKQVLTNHVLIHKSKKDIMCKICGKLFHSNARMRAHQITHNKHRAFKCSLCSTYVLHAEALERHYMNAHKQDYICQICNKSYKSRKALHNHESVHSAAKFKCPICSNMYKSTHILKEHLLKHQGIRRYKCDTCNKSFTQQSHLAAHMAVHSNITYNCPGCGKGFNRHDNMKVHTKRCELFLRNPQLQNSMIKRKISLSKNGFTSTQERVDNHYINTDTGGMEDSESNEAIENYEHTLSMEEL